MWWNTPIPAPSRRRRWRIDQALVKAEEILEDKGFENFVMRYYNLNNGILTINYAYSEKGITYYPDLLKIGIAMDNGQLVSLDAKGYIMNHTDRQLPQAQIVMAEAGENSAPIWSRRTRGRWR